MSPSSAASETQKNEAQQTFTASLDPHPGAVTFHTAYEHMYDVCSFQPRPTNTPGISSAIKMLK